MEEKTTVEVDVKGHENLVERLAKKPLCQTFETRLVFKNDDQRQAFDMLPLSRYEKEQLIYEIYPEYKRINLISCDIST